MCCSGCVETGLRRILHIRHGGDRHIAPSQHRTRHAEAALQTSAHIGDLLVEVRRHLAETIDVAAIVAFGAKLVAAEVVVQFAPKRRIAVERHLPLLELLIGDEVADLLAIDRVVHLIGGRQLLDVDGVELAHHLAPIIETLLLALRIDLIQPPVIGLRFARCADAGLAVAPRPFLLVDLLEACVGVLLRPGRQGQRQAQSHTTDTCCSIHYVGFPVDDVAPNMPTRHLPRSSY